MAYNRFITGILPEHNYRFIMGSITDVALEVGHTLGASSRIAALMGESMLGAFFLAGHNEKAHRTVVGIDMQCNGPAAKVLSFASSDGTVRAFCSHPEEDWSGHLYEGKKDGLLTVNRFVEDSRKVYSSSVAMHDLPFEKNLEEYLGRSDQKLGFIRMESILEKDILVDISGFSFEALPGAAVGDSERVLEMIRASAPADLVHGWISDGDGERRDFQSSISSVKILRTGTFEYRCDCNREKIEKVLYAMGEQSIRDLVEEKGHVEVFCEFCRKRYEFQPEEIDRLFRQAD
ncbi:MAG: Hsp33 family molecular chaperone HslO [Leptospiraceae bacterium]|nr:Hsp33 family molecular chaperone HslO [Leptospiraceae bacterium]